MHALPIIGIGVLVSGATTAWLATVLFVPRIRRFLDEHGVCLAGSRYKLPELQDYLKARDVAKRLGQNPEFLRKYEWLRALALCLLAAGIGLVLACDVIGLRIGETGSLAARMPTWAIVYSLFFIKGGAEYASKQLRHHGLVWRTTLDLTAELGRVTLFFAYWNTEVLVGFKYIAPFLFVYSWAVFGARTSRSALQARSNQSLISTPEDKRRILMSAAIVLMSAINFPLFWFGLKAAIVKL